jgi:xanthine/uracil permease
MTGVVLGGIFHFFLGFIVGRIRYALPPLVTGLIVLMIGLALVKVGIQYAAGGVPAMEAGMRAMAEAKAAGVALTGPPSSSAALPNGFPALVVIIVTLAIKFFTRGFLAVAAVLVGIIAGYIVALCHGSGQLCRRRTRGHFALPNPFRWGFELQRGHRRRHVLHGHHLGH